MPERIAPTDLRANVGLSHFVLRTAHLDETIEFYAQVVGMHINQLMPGAGAALSNDGEHHRIALASVPPAEGDVNPLVPGVDHVAYKMRTIADLLGNYKRLRDRGITPSMTIHHGSTLSAYYLDPNGVQVETFIDVVVRDRAAAMGGSHASAANQIGVPVDFDDLVARYEAGDALASLYEQPVVDDNEIRALESTVGATRGWS
jgi:catechol-2,3-dioxygenase